MERRSVFAWSKRNARELVALVCTVLLAVGDPGLFVQNVGAQNAAAEEPKLSNDQLDSLVAPLALYPDPLLAQTLAASTYPLEIIQLQQWMGKHKDLKGKALTDAVMKENWDPSVQAMAAFPDVVKQLADNVKWSSELGNAFLAQQSDVMDAVQRMRAKAKNNGTLNSSEQQKVETKTVESKQVIVIEPAKTEVIYVPSYNPTVVYGPPVVAYPPVYYPPPPPPGAYVATAAVSFGVGMMMGAAMSGGYGWGCGWGHNDVNVNVNNNYVKNSNVNRQNVNARSGGGNSWQHNPQHRGGAPYGNQATANKYGGNTRGASATDRQAGARQNQAGGAGGRQQPGATNRASSPGGAGGGRDMAAKPSTRDAGGFGGRGSERVGSRDVSSGSRNSGAFGSGGSSGASARSSSSRGASSMGSSSRGGGGFGGGGSRGGGGGRRR